MLFRHWTLRLFLLIAALTLITCGGTPDSQTENIAPDTMGALVTTQWLNEHLNDPNLIVLDCSVRMVPKEDGGMDAISGRADYDDGHIPSAGFADLLGALSDTASELGFALPTADQFCSAMGALGVGDSSRVVVYDNFNSVWAARVWWMLRWAGFDHAAILDGGLKAWTADGGAVSAELAEHQPARLTPHPRPDLIADKDEVFAAIDDSTVVIVDAMPAAHYRGDMAMYGRPGHIPSAINIPATSLIDESGRYLPHDELAAMCNADHGARVITYCGGGVAASSDAFTLHRLGYTDVAVYMASLQEWAADISNPLTVVEP